jgi:pimeloyl-ACP methyl ester carboxylesterase
LGNGKFDPVALAGRVGQEGDKIVRDALAEQPLPGLFAAGARELEATIMVAEVLDVHAFRDAVQEGGEALMQGTAWESGKGKKGVVLPHVDLDLSLVHQPTLLLWGGRDQTLAPDSFPTLADELSNVVKTKEFPICGHVPHQCHPVELNPLVMEFLQGV